MLQAVAERFRRCVRALVLPVLVLALIFAAPTSAFAADTDELLIIAVASGNTADVEFLLDDGVDVNHRLSNGATALVMASWNGHRKTVEALLARGAAINVQAETGETALFLASMNNHRDTVEVLLAEGAALDVQTNKGKTALSIASRKGYVEIVEALLARGAALDVQTNKTGATALIIASYQGHTQIVAALLAAGANTEVQTRIGKTAIDFSKNADIFNMLRRSPVPRDRDPSLRRCEPGGLETRHVWSCKTERTVLP